MDTYGLMHGPTIEQKKQQMEEWKSLSEQYGISLSFARFIKGRSFQGQQICQEILRDPTIEFGPYAYSLLGFWVWLESVSIKEWRGCCGTILETEKQERKKFDAMSYRKMGEWGDKAFRGVLAPDKLKQPIRTAIKSASVEAVNLNTMELYFLSMFGFSSIDEVRMLTVLHQRRPND
jgi:hypothetical protein